MAPRIENTRSNWFLTWDQDQDHFPADHQKSFLLQIKLQNLYHRAIFSRDVINSFVVIYRRQPSQRTWQEIGRTTIIRRDPNPHFPDGFRLGYEYDTDLSSDMLKIVCFRHRDTLVADEDVIGSAKISVRELVRAFGTRVQVELVKKKTNKIVGSAWFMGEPLPVTSPRGGANTMQFNISLLSSRRLRLGYQKARLFLFIERERLDSTWSAVYRSNIVKQGAGGGLLRGHGPLSFRPFQVRQSECVLGMSSNRKIRFSFMQEGRGGEPHICIGEVMTSVDELFNRFLEDTSLDFLENEKIVGEFACVSRREIDQITSFDVHIDYFSRHSEARDTKEKKNNFLLQIESP